MFPQATLNNLQTTLSLTATSFLTATFSFFPRLLATFVIFVFGVAIARWVRRLVIKTLERLRLSQEVEKTPIQAFLKNAEVTAKIEVIFATIIYWLILLVVVQTCVSLLGLTAVSTILNRILFYVPNIISAILVLFFGVILAGLAETVVKGTIKSLDVRSARLLGTVASYLVMAIAILAAISELGIAQQFITTLFTGIIVALALAFGLAFGLGSKDTVAKFMDEWYTQMRKDKEQH